MKMKIVRKMIRNVWQNDASLFVFFAVNALSSGFEPIPIARALYKDSSFIILDEPTAALDPLAEAEIYLMKSNNLYSELFNTQAAHYQEKHLTNAKLMI